MSAGQNQAAFREIITEAFNQGHYEVLRQHFKPDFVEHQFGLHVTIEGLQGDIQFLRKAFPDFNLTIEEMVAVDDKVWVRMTGRGTNLGGVMGSPNGKSFEVTVFDECRFEDGKIMSTGDRLIGLRGLSQLGLLPQREQAKV